MTSQLTTAQITTLTAFLLGEEPARAANRAKAISRFLATAEGHGLNRPGKVLTMAYDAARQAVETHARAHAAERAGDAVEVAMQVTAEATTRPRRRKVLTALPPVMPKTPLPSTADLAGKPWFRNGDKAEARMLAVMVEVGANKLKAFRDAFITGQDAADEWNALSQTQQNGILIRAMDKLMSAGKLTRDGLIYGVKAEFAKAA